MNSFLTRLSARAIGSARAVEPRLHGRFETIRRAGPPAATETEEFEEPVIAGTGRPERELGLQHIAASEQTQPLQRERDPVAGNTASHAAGPALPAALRAAATPESTPGPEPLLPVSPKAESRPDETNPDSERRTVPGHRAGSVPDPAIAARTRRHEVGSSSDPARLSHAEVGSPSAAAWDSSVEPSQRALAQVEVGTDPAFDAPERPRREPPQVAGQPAIQAAGRIEPSNRTSAQGGPRRSTLSESGRRTLMHRSGAEAEAEAGAPEPDPETVVYVRIGRVDVKAVMPAPQPAPRSVQQPIESLEDYLARTSTRR